MDKPKIKITSHAIDKYCDLKRCVDRKTAEQKLKEYYRWAKKVFLPPDKAAKRILNGRRDERGQLVETEYYEYKQFRMAIADGVMVTFEEKYY